MQSKRQRKKLKKKFRPMKRANQFLSHEEMTDSEFHRAYRQAGITPIKN